MTPPRIVASRGVAEEQPGPRQTGVSTVSSRKNMLTSALGRTRDPLARRTVASGTASSPLSASQPHAGKPNAPGSASAASETGKKISAIRAEDSPPMARLVATFLPVARITVKAQAEQKAESRAKQVSEGVTDLDPVPGDDRHAHESHNSRSPGEGMHPFSEENAGQGRRDHRGQRDEKDDIGGGRVHHCADIGHVANR